MSLSRPPSRLMKSSIWRPVTSAMPSSSASGASCSMNMLSQRASRSVSCTSCWARICSSRVGSSAMSSVFRVVVGCHTIAGRGRASSPAPEGASTLQHSDRASRPHIARACAASLLIGARFSRVTSPRAWTCEPQAHRRQPSRKRLAPVLCSAMRHAGCCGSPWRLAVPAIHPRSFSSRSKRGAGTR